FETLDISMFLSCTVIGECPHFALRLPGMHARRVEQNSVSGNNDRFFHQFRDSPLQSICIPPWPINRFSNLEDCPALEWGVARPESTFCGESPTGIATRRPRFLGSG